MRGPEPQRRKREVLRFRSGSYEAGGGQGARRPTIDRWHP